MTRASGEVDGERLPKEAYYVCQTMFRSDPQIHIIGHWNYPAGTKKSIYVVSNCSDVELFVNGKSLGHGKVSEHYLFTFENVAWEPGEIKAVACKDGKEIISESKHTVGPPVALKLTPILGPDGLQANGSDVVLIDVEAVDANGERCPTFQQRVDFDISGPGIWRGGYNSGKTNSINNKYLDLECGINRVAVRSTETPGRHHRHRSWRGSQAGDDHHLQPEFCGRKWLCAAKTAVAAAARFGETCFYNSQAFDRHRRKSGYGTFFSPRFPIPVPRPPSGSGKTRRMVRGFMPTVILFSVSCRHRLQAATGCRRRTRTSFTAQWICWIFR